MPDSRNITVHAWSDPHLLNINPLVWIDHGSNPDAVADAAIVSLNSKPPGCKAVLHRYGMMIDVPSNRASFTVAGNADAIVEALRAGPDISVPLRWTQTFYRRLHRADIIPDWIVCDEEGGWNYWQIPLLSDARNVPAFEKILADPIVRSKMPADLLALSPGDFAGHSRNFHRAVLAWNHWTNKITTDAIRAVLLDTATEIFGTTPDASNFGDVHPTFQIYDVNGWEIPRDANCLSDWSSPAIYLVPGNRQNFGRRKHPCWNIFIDNLNAIRSCVGSNQTVAPNAGPHVAPWISHPSYSGDHAHRSPVSMRWLWTEQLRHAHASGIETFLYWNPAEIKTFDPRADDRFAGQIFSDLSARPTTPQSLAPISLDANQVISHNYITTYAEFEKNFPVE